MSFLLIQWSKDGATYHDLSHDNFFIPLTAPYFSLSDHFILLSMHAVHIFCRIKTLSCVRIDSLNHNVILYQYTKNHNKKNQNKMGNWSGTNSGKKDGITNCK